MEQSKALASAGALRKYAKPMAFAAVCAAIWFAGRVTGFSAWLTDAGTLETFRLYAEGNFIAAAAVYILVTAAACVLLALPGVFFAIAGGVLFGPVWGTVLCLVAATLGAVAAFLAGRYFLRGSVKPMLKKSPALEKLLFADDGRNAVWLLLVTRLVPIFPYNIQNFAYGITDIGLLPYTVCTFIFMTPGVALFTVGTAGLAAKEGRGTLLAWSAGIAVFTAAAGALMYYFYKKQNKKEEE